MHLLLHCMDLSSRLHMLEASERPWKQRGLLMAFFYFHTSFWNTEGASFHSEESVF